MWVCPNVGTTPCTAVSRFKLVVLGAAGSFVLALAHPDHAHRMWTAIHILKQTENVVDKAVGLVVRPELLDGDKDPTSRGLRWG